MYGPSTGTSTVKDNSLIEEIAKIKTPLEEEMCHLALKSHVMQTLCKIWWRMDSFYQRSCATAIQALCLKWWYACMVKVCKKNHAVPVHLLVTIIFGKYRLTDFCVKKVIVNRIYLHFSSFLTD